MYQPQRFLSTNSDLLIVVIVLFWMLASPVCLSAQNTHFSTGETGLLGTQTSNDFNATIADDDTLEKIAEQKDATGNYRIEWTWHFDVIGTSDSLHLEGQATNTRHGMDFYDFYFKRPNDSDWTLIGTVNQTTLTPYNWPMEGISGPVEIKAIDTNPDDDAKRANQLWIDYLYIQSTGDVVTPLGAPSDLSAQAISETEIQLIWSDNASAETGFLLERKMEAGEFTEVATLDANADAYLDTGLSPLTTYSYRVRAHDAGAGTTSAYSNEASAITQTTIGGATGPNTDKIIAGYFPSWGIYNARKHWVRYIPFDRITHVNYAFANVDPISLEVVIGDSFAEESNTKDPETDNGLPAGNLHQLTHYRDHGHNGPAYEHLKVIISVGGWTWSENFSNAALTAESRWRFAESLKDFVATYNLDGADLDWEFPTGDSNNCGEAGNVCRPEDPVNHALLIMACRAKLDELGPGKELSIAMPAGFETIAKVMPPLVDNGLLVNGDRSPMVYMRNPETGAEKRVGTATAVDMLDYVHIMIYDLAGASWDDTTRHHAPLYGYDGDPAGEDPEKENLTKYNSHFAIQAYRYTRDDYANFDPDAPDGAAEIPTSKLTFGVPMYGRGFKSVDAGHTDGYEGLFQFTDDSTRRRVPKGTWDGGKWGNTGVFAYWDILLNYGGDATSADDNIWRVETAGPYGPYILQGDLFIGFDDRDSLTDKMIYLTEYDMAGVMFWDFPGDLSQAQVDQGIPGAAANHPEKSLIHHIAKTLEDIFATTEQ
jgi:chitinase